MREALIRGEGQGEGEGEGGGITGKDAIVDIVRGQAAVQPARNLTFIRPIEIKKQPPKRGQDSST